MAGATTESSRAALSLSGGTGMPRRRNGDERMRPAKALRRPVLDVGRGDEPAEAVAEQKERPSGLLLAHGLQVHGRVVEIVR